MWLIGEQYQQLFFSTFNVRRIKLSCMFLPFIGIHRYIVTFKPVKCPRMSSDSGQIAYTNESVLSMHVHNTNRHTQIHICSRRHNATAGLASYEHFLQTQAQLWTRSFSSIAGLALQNMYRGASSRPLFALRFQRRHHPALDQLCTVTPFVFFTFFSLACALFHSRNVIAACIFYETSLRACTYSSNQPAIHPSIHP